MLQTQRLKACYERGIDRLEGRWPDTGTSGDQFASSGHKYEKDLHIFGKGSLFQLLCTCRTQVGRRRLAEYLLETADLDQIVRRQCAIQELQNEVALREKVNLIGEFSFQESTWDTVVEWLDRAPTNVYGLFRAIAFGSSGALACLLLLGFASVITWTHLAFWIWGLLLLNGALGLSYRARLLDSMQAIRGLSLEIGILREGLSLLQVQQFRSALLTELVVSARDSNAGVNLRKLERLAATMTERNKEWFYAISRALLVGTQTFLAIEKWRTQHGRSLREWLRAWGEFESLLALAGYAYEHPGNTFPQLSRDRTMLEAKGLGHPLLPVATCVLNDVSLNEYVKFYVISGSNMAGKSTLLRAIGLNAVLAYAGAPVVAKEMTLSRFAICASLTHQDSLLSGKSKFLVEMERVKLALTVAKDQGPVLFLFDEILAGTNSIDRRSVAEAIIRALVERGALGALSTHDLALTELGSSVELSGTNMHMASNNDWDPLNFNYVLKPGPTTQSSALAIAKLAGVFST